MVRHLDATALAEVDGGPLVSPTSIYLYLEEGLARSPHKPAIISTHQPVGHLGDLLALCEELPAKTETDTNARSTSLGDCARVSISSHGLCLSYQQVHHMAQELAAGFLSNHIQSGSTILLLVPNSAEFGLLLWSSILFRLTVSCADPNVLREDGQDRLLDLLRTIKPQLVVVADPETASAVDAAFCELQLAWPLRICLTQSVAQSGWKALVDIMAQGVASAADREKILEDARNDDPQRVHSILFTSGSSGRPKGCPMRVGGQTHYMQSQAWLVDHRAAPFALQQAHPSRAIAHLQTLLTWKAGGTVVMTGRGFAIEDVSYALQLLPITFLALSPPMVHELHDLATQRSLDVASVQTVQVGGDAVTKGILLKCGSLFPGARIVVAHGMTEGGGSFYWPFATHPLDRVPYFGELCPVGAVAPGSVVKIWDVNRSRVCARGEPGALHVSSGSLVNVYLLGASEPSFYIDSRGRRWFDTGDIAVMDTHGIVSILGRAKNMIRRGDLTLMPATIENCIETYTGEQTVLVSVPHATLGVRCVAVLRSFAGRNPADINQYLEHTLAESYRVDAFLTLEDLNMDCFPINATHKVVRSEVQQAVMRSMALFQEVQR